jgi:hypothetical protein
MFCNFCKSVGHEEKDCHAFDLMRECTADAYRVQGEESEGGASQYNTPRGYNQGGRGGFRGHGRGGFVEEEDQLYVITVIILDIWHETS